MEAEEIKEGAETYKRNGIGSKYDFFNGANWAALRMQSTIDQQKAEIERLNKQLADNEKFVSESISEATYQTSQCIALQSQLTEANQRGEKLKEALLHIISKDKTGEYYIQLNHDIRVIAKQALSEYNSTKVK